MLVFERIVSFSGWRHRVSPLNLNPGGHHLEQWDSIVSAASRDRCALTIIAAILVSAALYSARVVFEPIAFTFFAMALVWPFQKAVEARMPKPAALALTILLTLAVISMFALAVIWSIGESD